MKISLKNMLMLFFGVLIILPVAAGNIMLLDVNTQATQEHMRLLNRNNARLSGMKVSEMMNAIFQLSIYTAIESSIVDYLNASGEDLSVPMLRGRAQRTLTTLMMSSNYLTSVSIAAMDGRTISRGSIRTVEITEEDRVRADALEGYFFWDTGVTEQGAAIYLCRLIRDVNDFSNHLGYIKMMVGMKGLSDLLVPVDNLFVHFVILDEEERVVFSSGNPNLQSDDHYVSAYALSNGWQLFSIAPNATLLLPGFAQTATIVMAFVLVICMLLANLFSALIVKPLKHLRHLMRQVGKGDFSVHFDIPKESEVRLLALEFNQMLVELNRLYNEVYNYQLQSYKAKLIEMESKINPHFLYNTLDSIYWMAKLQRHEEVGGMANALSKLLRLALSADSSGFVRLSEELEYLSCYLQIQRYRYGDNIVFTTAVDNNLRDQSVCRFVLQPIVENAIIHGLADQTSGTVNVQVFREGAAIVYRVSDSGGCVNPEELHRFLRMDEDEIEGTKGLALHNIQRRIRLCHGQAYGVVCFIEGAATVFEVRQPYAAG